MLLYLVAAFFFVSATTAYRVVDDRYDFGSETEELVWPERYMVKAIRWSLTSNLIEDYTAWKTNFTSRVDYNYGAVKVITIIPEIEEEDVLNNKYEIRPVTTEDELNKISCISSTGTDDDIQLDEILPVSTDEEFFEPIGNETIDGLETMKFEYIEKTSEKEKRQTVWAYYDNMGMGEYGWIPVRYELKKYNVVLGSLERHDIWEYSGFDQDFDDPFVFNVEVCTDEDTYSWHSEKVTKDLTFVDPENDDHVDHVFNSFKIKFDRKYDHEFEHTMRRMIFQENMRMVRSVNKQNLGYTLAINQFSDRTEEEMQGSLGILSLPPNKEGTNAFPYDQKKLTALVNDLPDEYDARLDGLVSPIKNQETCGSCWTFAATAVVEGSLIKANGGRMMSLSNQAIIDCAYDGLVEMGAGGCQGGYDTVAYDWIMKHGLPTDEEYGPYKNREGYCHIENVTNTYRINGYTNVTPFSNNAIKVSLVKYGPLFIYIHISPQFKAYSGGIFYQNEEICPVFAPNHGVALIGYGNRDGEPYWVLKNSWGTSWGVDGYMLISARDNVCGVASHPSYPVL